MSEDAFDLDGVMEEIFDKFEAALALIEKGLDLLEQVQDEMEGETDGV